MPLNKKAPQMQGFKAHSQLLTVRKLQSLFRKCYCDLTNNIRISESVNLVSYLIFDGEIDDKEFYRCNLRG